MALTTNKRRPIIVGPNIPEVQNNLDIWVNTTNNTIYRYDNENWISITSASAFSGSANYTAEQIQDIVAPLLNHSNHTNLTVVYNDSLNRIEFTNTALSPATASTTYLTQANAAGTYLTQTNASATYLIQSNASATYATKTELNNIDLSATIQTASAAAVTYLVNSAPSTLDTLNELATALGNDANFSTTVTNSLAGKLNTSTASATYLTQSSASSTYLTQASASTQYEKLIPYSASAPSSPAQGDLWVDSTVPTIKAYIGSQWVSVGGGASDSDQAIISGRMFA